MRRRRRRKRNVWWGTYLVGRGESALIGSDAVDEFVAVGFPGRGFAGGGVELVVEQTERLLAGERRAREQGTVAHRELDFDVDAVGLAALDERRPQPIVDVVVGHVAHHVRAPVDALLEVGEALFYPLQSNNNKPLVIDAIIHHLPFFLLIISFLLLSIRQLSNDSIAFHADTWNHKQNWMLIDVTCWVVLEMIKLDMSNVEVSM